MPKLHILSGVLEGKTFDLVEDRITLGRALDNLIRLEDGTISHHHAMLVLDNNQYALRDLNSTNGSRVNGIRVVETKLNNGDQVRMGSVEMRFESDMRKASQPLPPSRAGIDSSMIGKGGTPPPEFGSASPFRHRKTTSFSGLQWLVIVLGLVAAGAVALFLIRFL